MRLVLGLVLFSGVIANIAPASAKAPDVRDLKTPELERACHVLQAELGDCECTARFLEHRLGQDQGLLLLRVWAAGPKTSLKLSAASVISITHAWRKSRDKT